MVVIRIVSGNVVQVNSPDAKITQRLHMSRIKRAPAVLQRNQHWDEHEKTQIGDTAPTYPGANEPPAVGTKEARTMPSNVKQTVATEDQNLPRSPRQAQDKHTVATEDQNFPRSARQAQDKQTVATGDQNLPRSPRQAQDNKKVTFRG